MWIIIQLILSPVVFALLRSTVSRSGLNNNVDNGMEEHFDHYTVTELHKIKLFRVMMKDLQLMEYEKSDDFLIRWLREDNMDLKSANQSLRHAMKWRRDNQMDTILNKTITTNNILPPIQCNVEGIDKNGGPIIIYKSKGYDVRKVLAHGYREKSLSQFSQCFERYLHKSISGGSKIEQIRMTPGTSIFDAEGSAIRQHGCLKCVDFYREVYMNGFQFYPRSSTFHVFINAAPFVRQVIEILKPFLSPHTRNSIKIFGNDREEWSQFLLSVIPKDQLPSEYGGTKQRESHV